MPSTAWDCWPKNEGDVPTARSLFEAGLALFKDLEDKWGVATVTGNFGVMAIDRGELDQGQSLLKESLVLFEELGNKPGMTECLDNLADAARGLGQPLRAARLWGAAEGVRGTTSAGRWPSDEARYLQAFSQARSQLGDAAWEKAWQEGRFMSLKQAIEYATE